MKHDARTAGSLAQARLSSAVRSFFSLAAGAAIALVAGTAGAAHETLGDAALLASFQGPGYPEGIVVEHDRVYVAGPANFDQPSVAVRVYNPAGKLMETIPVTHAGADPTDALSCITSDGDGALYVLSEAQGIVRLTKHGHTWHQELYAPLPTDGLPGCVHGYQLAPDPSDPMYRVGCHLLNDLAFDADGRLYVTDSFRATIYRVEPGGGAMEPWFVSPYLLGGPPFPIGTNGVRVAPTGDELYFTVTTSPLPDVAGQGRLYKLPLVDAPEPEDLAVVHAWDPGLGPDGIAFGESGEIYTALAFSNQVSILDPAGGELMRLGGPIGSPVPYDAPANVAFDGRGSIYVTNHALLSNNTGDMGVLKVWVGDKGHKLFKPDCE
jgi:sugar lactone lactonase YvrE